MIIKGFSLLEMIIVMAIIAIFAFFTYPYYRNSITQGRRIDGQTALLALANRLEQYYSEHNTYQGATLATGGDTDILSTNYSDQNWYMLTITGQTDNSFHLKATPIGTQAIDDKLCQTLTFNSYGIKGISTGPGGVPTATANQCW